MIHVDGSDFDLPTRVLIEMEGGGACASDLGIEQDVAVAFITRAIGVQLIEVANGKVVRSSCRVFTQAFPLGVNDRVYPPRFVPMVNQHIEPSHSGHYVDPFEHKTREYDLRVRANRDTLVTDSPSDISMPVHLSIECKNLSPARPLVVSTVPDLGSREQHIRFVAMPYVSGMAKAIHCRTFDPAPSGPIYTTMGPEFTLRIGCSFDQVMAELDKNKERLPLTPSRKDAAYGKWRQAVNASLALTDDEIVGIREKIGNHTGTVQFWSLPILVVPDGTLWLAEYPLDQPSVPKVARANAVRYKLALQCDLPRSGVTVETSCMFIMTEAGLEAFVSGVICA